MATKRPGKRPAKKAVKRPAPRSGMGARPGGGKTRDEEGEFGVRADKATGEEAVVEMIASLKSAPRDVCAKLHDIIMEAAPAIEPHIKWGMPVYTGPRGMVCYAAPYDAYVRFGFYDRTGLDGLDEGQGVGGSVKFARSADVDAKRVAGWIKKALARSS